ncbi:MAG TPA: V-type ATP synthase subunit E, partial [Chloroflexota bacterium]|nr:V-type ATP synthase subunit E [Chloroflexota bacterium]
MANLSALLDKEASLEIEAILSEARERASEIVAKAREEADTVVAQQERVARTQYDAALVRSRSG